MVLNTPDVEGSQGFYGAVFGWGTLTFEASSRCSACSGSSAGGVRSGSIKRCASAVGEGSMAVRLVHQYLVDAGMQNV